MATPALLTIRLEHEFAADMEALRRAGWSEPLDASTRDEFDQDSLHLTIWLSGRPISMIRATQGPLSPLLAWSRGRAPLPSDPSVAELTRGVVAPAMRHLGLYRLAMLETMLRLPALGVLIVTAAIKPAFPARFFLAELGFLNIGTPIVFDDRPRWGTHAQCIRLDMTPDKQRQWLALWQCHTTQLLEYGYLIDSDIPMRVRCAER